MGTAVGMTRFPSEPVPGHPGASRYAREDEGAERGPHEDGNLVWDKPEYVSYPGSIEHFRNQNQKYIYPINPFNHRSLIKNFLAHELPGIDAKLVEEFAEPVHYVFRGEPGFVRTGQKRPPVKVVRIKPGGQRLKFELAPLPVGMYVVRLIGALETKDAGFTPKDLIIDMKINDRPDGTNSHYVLRQRGTDNFYSLGEHYFHVQDGRRFDIDVGLHPDSEVDLLVHNVDVHDVLAECARKAGKREPVMLSLEALASHWKEDPTIRLSAVREGRWLDAIKNKRTLERRLRKLREQFPGKSDAECLAEYRRLRDDALWNSFPPLNVNWGQHTPATKKLHPKLEDLKERGHYHQFSMYGGSKTSAWKFTWPKFGGAGGTTPWQITKKNEDGTTLVYTLADLVAGRPLPDDPLRTPPWGLRFADDQDNDHYYYPLARAASGPLQWANYILQDYDYPTRGTQGILLKKGDMEAAYEYALTLCRFAYDMPAHSEAHRMKNILTHPKDFFWRHIAHQFRLRLYQVRGVKLLRTHDYLFPVIKDNQVLAESVGRHIPWVKTPDDVIQLLDTYLVQYMAKQTMYYQHYYDHAHSALLAQIAAIQNDPVITRPWLDFIFSRTWEYPSRDYGSLRDFVYLSTQRDGTTNIGSYMYAMAGGIGAQAAPWLKLCVEHGADPKYDLSDPKRFPRVAAMPIFAIESRVAGLFPPHVGDIGGPYSAYGHWFKTLNKWVGHGWEWTRDPRFAYCLVHYAGRTGQSDAEWQEIKRVAAGQRNPFMANRSRVLSDWGGILEAGTHSDDFRFRHAARVRVGRGWGHAHYDTLDLCFWSMGLTMMPDAGARPGYGRPGSNTTMVHNGVMVDGENFMGHGWIAQLADCEGCQYLRGKHLDQKKQLSRQVALIEVDRGRPARNPPSDPSLKPGTTYDPDIVLPKAYLVDVFRVTGGREHAYGFHGPPDDAFETNLPREDLTADEKEWMKPYVIKGEQWAGTIGNEGLRATWRFSRSPMTFDVPGRGTRHTRPNPEKAVLGAAYDGNSPRKYLRVHVPGQRGARMLTGRYVCAPYGAGRKDGETFRQVHLVRRGDSEKTFSLYAAVHEAYAGAPFITKVWLERQANIPYRPAIVHIETKDGRHDVLIAGPQWPPLMSILGEIRLHISPALMEDGTHVSANFAYISRDGKGLRQVTLVGGRNFKMRALSIIPMVPEWAARAVSVDYAKREAVLSRPFPLTNPGFTDQKGRPAPRAFPSGLLDGAFFAVGGPWTSFQAIKLTQRGDRTVLRWRKDATLFSGEIKETKAKGRWGLEVTFRMAPSMVTGENTALRITNSKGVEFWHCGVEPLPLDVSGVPGKARIRGVGLSAKDFPVGERFTLYQFGVGDVWRTPSKVSLRRVTPGTYRLEANTPFTITLAAEKAEWSHDQKTWTPLSAAKQNGRLTWDVQARQLQQPVYLRWHQGP